MSHIDDAVRTLARQIEGVAYENFSKEFHDAAISLTNLIRNVAPEGVSHDEKDVLVQKLLSHKHEPRSVWHDCDGIRETWVKLTTQNIIKERTKEP